MAISFVGFSTKNVASGTSIGVVAPTGLAAGHLLLAMVNVKGATETINTPTGWTQVNGTTINQSKTTVACFYKVAAAGDVGATLTFTYSTTAIATAVVVAYSGVDQNNPLPSVGSGNGTTNTSGTWTDGGITISNANDQIVSLIGIEDISSVTYTVPTGYTKRVTYGYNTSNYESILIADKMVTAAGASGTTTWDASASLAVNYAQFDLELQQAVVDATVTPTGIASGESFGSSSIGLISLRSTPTTGTDYVSRGTITANLPSGVVAGDLLIAVVNATSGSTDPSGWTPIATSAVLGPGGTYVHAYYKVATASEPASYTFNDGSSGYGQVIIAAYANTNQSIDASTVVNLSNGSQNVASLVPGTVTTSLNNELVLVLGGTYSEAGTLSSSYWQFDAHLAYNANTDIFIAEGQQSAAGTSSSTAITHSSVDVDNAGLITVALKPAGQVGPSDQSLSPTAIVTAESFGSTSVAASNSIALSDPYALQSGNLVASPDDLTQASWTNANSAVAAYGFQAPDGSLTATHLTGTSASYWMSYVANSLTTQEYIIRAWVKSNTGSNQAFALGIDNTGASRSADLTATTSWQHFSYQTSGFTATYAYSGIYHDAAQDAGDLLVWHFDVVPLSGFNANAGSDAIPSSENFGTAALATGAVADQSVTAPAIASAEAFGSDTVVSNDTVDVTGHTIPTSEVFGTASIDAEAYITGPPIASAEAFGTDTVTTANSVTASAIPSAEAFGTVVLGAAVVPSSIASAERFGSDTLTTTASITVSSIPSAESFGATTMGTGGSVAPQPITSAEAFGTDTVVAGPVTVAENSIPSAESFGTASITTAATISVSSIPSAESFGTDRLDRNVTVASIPSAESMGSDSLTVVTVISPSSISSGGSFGTTQITTGGSIAVYTIPSAESFGSAVIVYDQKITIASIGSAESFGSDTVVAGAVTVSPPGVPLDSNVWSPSVALVDIIGLTSIASSEHFGLAVIDVSIAVTTISSSESVPAPDVLLNNIFVGAISSAESFGTAIIGFDTRLQSNERYLIVASDRSRIVGADERTTVIEATVRNRVITG